MSDHANDCPECGHENCEHTSWMRELTTVTLSGAEMAALIEGQRAQNVALEMRIEELVRKGTAWKETVQGLRDTLRQHDSEMAAAQSMIQAQGARLRQLESDIADARGVNAALVRRQQDPSATEEALHDQVEKVRAYVKGLRIWGTEDKAQICTDILYIIGEN